MSIASRIIFKAFLDGCDPKKQESLLRYLPDSEIDILSHLSPSFEDLSQGIDRNDTLLDTFHPSWFEPLLRALSSNDLTFILAAFSLQQQGQLVQTLGFSNTLPTLTPIARGYLRSFLLHELKKDVLPLIPLECLPTNPFNRLLPFSYVHKLKLIDLLSMYDLSNEQKNIIEKRKLTHITSTLSEDERTLLNRLSKHTENLTFKSMNLNKWDENPATLRTLLRQRGINRLSKATYGSDPSFQWYFCHQLDTTSASLFQKLHTSLENPAATKLLQEQVLSLMELFKDYYPKEGQSK